MRTRIASAALIVLAALPLAAGAAVASDQEVSAKTWVHAYCKLTLTELESIAASKSWFDTTIRSAPTRETFRDTLVAHIDRQVAAVDVFVQRVDAVGVPNVPNGRKLVHFLLRNEEAYRAALAKARDDAFTLDMTDDALAAQNLQRIQEDGRAASAAYDDALTSAKVPPEIDRWLARDPVCSMVRKAKPN
jgi:hypothetical protein